MITTNVISMKDNEVTNIESFITSENEPQKLKNKTRKEITKTFERMALNIGASPEDIDKRTVYYYNEHLKESVQIVSVLSSIFIQQNR